MKTDCIFYVASYDLKFRCCKRTGTLYVKGEEDNTKCEGCRLWDNYIPQSATEEEKIKAMYISEVSEIDAVLEVKEAIRCISNDDIIADIKESNNSLTHTLNYYIDKNSPFEHIINSWAKNMDSMRPINNFNLSNIRIIK